MKSFKRMAALCLAVGMILTAASTALAAEGQLVVHGSKEFKGKNVTAIRMFKATFVDGEGGEDGQIDEGDSVSYELETAWEGLFTMVSEGEAGKINVSSNAGDTLAEKAYDYVLNLGSDTPALIEFAKQAAAYAKTNAQALAPLTYTAAADADGDGATATFETMAVGYYLVLPQTGSTSVDRQTDAMLVNVPSAKSVKLDMKSEYPTVTKEASDTGDGAYGENTTAQIGDTVYFRLTSKVPDMSAYTTYTFKFNDTLSEGLTFDASSVVVKVGDATLDSTKYTVTPTEDTAAANVIIDLSSSIKEQTAGADIVVTYAATLNEDAVIGTTANGNSAEVEYSNDPSAETTGHSLPDITETYTYAIQVHKYATGDDDGYLAGATFILSASDTLEGTPTAPNYDGVTNAIKLVESDGTYRVAKADEEGSQTYFTTNGTDNITINGLKAGTYFLHEVAAPDGYNKLTEPVQVEIQVTGEEGADPAPSYAAPVYVISIGEEPGTSSASNEVKIENKSGAMLPETGGIGTIGLTIAGVAVVLLGIFLPRRKKKNGKSNGSKA